MKILFSCLSKSWGGMEMYTITALKQLLKRNVRVDLLCAAESRIHIEANNLGVIIHPVKATGYLQPSGILKIYAVARRGEYDLIHTQYTKDLWLIVPALKLLRRKIPVVLTKHMGSFIVKKDFLHRWIYRNVTLALAISRIIKKNLVETTPLRSDKIKILHNGIDLNRFNPEKADREKIRNEFGIKGSDILTGMLARFSPGKGHEEFLTAARALSVKYDNLKFIIIGEASRGELQYEQRIKQMAEGLKLNNLIFAGFRSDTPDVLSAMDIFAFPSHAEAFGIALAEAMVMGLPCAASNSDGVLDLVVDNETGLLFENKNAADLEKKIEVLLNSEALRTSLGTAARKRAIENFDIEIITDKTINIYNQVLRDQLSAEGHT